MTNCNKTADRQHLKFVLTARCYASAVLATALCLSVRPSQVGVILKRLNVGSHKQHHSSVLKPKISAKFDRGYPLRGRQMQVGLVEIGDSGHPADVKPSLKGTYSGSCDTF